MRSLAQKAMNKAKAAIKSFPLSSVDPIILAAKAAMGVADAALDAAEGTIRVAEAMVKGITSFLSMLIRDALSVFQLNEVSFTSSMAQLKNGASESFKFPLLTVCMPAS